MSIKPDVVFKLSPEQLEIIAELKAEQKNSSGMIFGSVGIERDGDTIAPSYIPHETAVKIAALAEKEMEEKDANS